MYVTVTELEKTVKNLIVKTAKNREYPESLEKSKKAKKKQFLIPKIFCTLKEK